MIEAFPLQWPVGYPRTMRPQSSRFEKHSLTEAKKAVRYEIGMLKGTNPVISTNIPLCQDGEPRADYQRRRIADFAVAVYFHYKGSDVVLACDRWATIEENLWAVSLSIAAMRGLERWGVSDILDRAFTGFKALPSAELSSGLSCWDYLSISATRNESMIKEAYWLKAKAAAGDENTLRELNIARYRAISYAQGKS